MAEAVISIPGFGESIGREAVTVDATVGGKALGATKYKTAGSQGPLQLGVFNQHRARVAVLNLESQPIRYTLDGTAPTTTYGHLLVAGQWLIIQGAGNIAKFRAIRTTGSSGTLQAEYFL